MPNLNLGDLSANADHLAGQLLDTLKAELLGNLTDPESVAMAERATATLATVPIALIGAPADVAADLKNQYDAALSVLYSLASAEVEDAAKAAARVRETVNAVIAQVIRDALAVAFAAI